MADAVRGVPCPAAWSGRALKNVYSKLGITSRSQLAARLVRS